MRYLLPFLLVGLAACYSPRSVGPGPDGYAPGLYGATSYEPLQASLWIDPYTGFASFDVNRDAHVALFAWAPGGYFEMLYPAIGFGTRQEFASGRHYLRTLHNLAHGPARRNHMHGRFVSASAATGPTYYTLIASAEPLDIRPFYGREAWVQRTFWSHNPYTATELLASQIVPRPATTEWTAAYQVVWLDDTRNERWHGRDNFRWIQCPDGTILAVPLEALLAGTIRCPSGDPVDPTPEDSAAIQDGDVTRRVAERRAERSAMEAGRASDEELAGLIRQIRETRGRPALDGDELPVPSWRRTARGERVEEVASAPVPLRERPDIGRTHEDAAGRAADPAAQASTRPSPRGVGPRTRVDRDRPQADAPATTRAERTRPRAERTRPQADRTRPAAQSPRPQAERPRPRADSPRSEGARSQPERSAPSSPPSRPAPQSPPDRDGG